MLKISIQGLGNLSGRLSATLNSLDHGILKDQMLRTLAFTAGADVKKRVHVDGIKVDGEPIGEYSPSYLKRRIRTGKTSSKKIIFSYTRQMQNDFTLTASDPIKTDSGYGLGFKNPLNADKRKWLEEGREAHTVKEHTRKLKKRTVKVKAHQRKGSPGFGQAYGLNQIERQRLQKVANDFINKNLSGK